VCVCVLSLVRRRCYGVVRIWSGCERRSEDDRRSRYGQRTTGVRGTVRGRQAFEVRSEDTCDGKVCGQRGAHALAERGPTARAPRPLSQCLYRCEAPVRCESRGLKARSLEPRAACDSHAGGAFGGETVCGYRYAATQMWQGDGRRGTLWDVLLGRCVFGTDIRGQHSAPECVPAVATPSTPAASAIVDDHVSERSVREAASHLLTTGCNQGASLWHHSRDITAEGTSEYSVRERRIHIRMRMPLPSQMLKAWGTRMRGQVR